MLSVGIPYPFSLREAAVSLWFFTPFLESVHWEVLHSLNHHHLPPAWGNKTPYSSYWLSSSSKKVGTTSNKHTKWISKYFLLDCLHTWKKQQKVFNVHSLITSTLIFQDGHKSPTLISQNYWHYSEQCYFYSTSSITVSNCPIPPHYTPLT